MASVEAATPFRRSHSTPDLLGGMSPSPPASDIEDLTSLPAFDIPSFDLDTDFCAGLGFGDQADALKTVTTERTTQVRAQSPQAAVAASTSSETVDHKSPGKEKLSKLGRRMSVIDRPRIWLPSSKSSPNVRGLMNAESRELPNKVQQANGTKDDDTSADLLRRSRTVDSFADFARRSWMTSSRSPSPPSSRTAAATAPGEEQGRGRRKTVGQSMAKVGLGFRKVVDTPAETDAAVERNAHSQSPSTRRRTLSRASVYLSKLRQSPQNVFVTRSASSPMLSYTATTSSPSKKTGSNSSRSTLTVDDQFSGPVPALPKFTDETENLTISIPDPRHSSHTTTSSAASDITGAPSENASHSTAETSVTMPPSTTHDPHWALFRSINDELATLVAKSSTSARMAHIRAILVPFLRSTALHPSNTNRKLLGPEDVERRMSILNRWWNELLRMLDGNQNSLALAPAEFAPADAQATPATNGPLQPVAGVDRPLLLEALTLIMRRPEWRICTSSFRPLADRSPTERVRARSWTPSTSDEDEQDLAAMLVESAEHNVRTMFVQNLLRQMALVVDKMSQRHAPTSLVNWCGKACAYAFFFVPGIADILVRLWSVRADLLRRVADEFHLPKSNRGESDDIVALFPPCLGLLGWTSVREMERNLKTAAKQTHATAQMQWHGPWVSRWRGGDTDLLFIFTKYYYILADEFMPGGLPLLEKARAPAFVLLHAQLLGSLDATIHRHEATSENWAVMDSADAVALPLPGNNVLKGMDENRMVVLLKDMLADTQNGPTMSEAFVAIMRAAAKKTSVYDTSACCVMLDFFEQLLTLKVPVDLRYWLEMFKPILNQSENSMTEVKLITFLYAVWDEIVADPSTKEAICCDWLLSEAIWNKFFNNWCSLTRSYFMRLICWRMCRVSESVNELDDKIFSLVTKRLRTTWSHYLWARDYGTACPSSIPALPAPAKRFIILRSELAPPQAGLLMPFDTFPSAIPDTTRGPFLGGLVGREAPEPTNVQRPDLQATAYKKKWTILGKVLSFSGGAQNNLNMAVGAASSSSNATKRTWDEELELARRETAASRSRTGSRMLPAPLLDAGPSASPISSTGSSPTFAPQQFVFRFGLQPYPYQTKALMLGPPRLPGPAQFRVGNAASSSVRIAPEASTDVVSHSDSSSSVVAVVTHAARRGSGPQHSGLVREARNARPLDTSPSRAGPEMIRNTDHGQSDWPATSNPGLLAGEDHASDSETCSRGSSHGSDEHIWVQDELRPYNFQIRPTEPTGIYALNVTYTGRALAEWTIIVNEYNSFSERRRDEGVVSFASVEIPLLSMEGLGFKSVRG